MVGAAALTGRVGLLEPLAEALAAFRHFNYERIYLRPASVEQGERVVRLLQALVEHYATQPGCLPAEHRASGTTTAGPTALRASVGYVGGMTDRFACEQAVTLLGWPTEALPAGFDVRG
jgi:dGTPase